MNKLIPSFLVLAVAAALVFVRATPQTSDADLKLAQNTVTLDGLNIDDSGVPSGTFPANIAFTNLNLYNNAIGGGSGGTYNIADSTVTVYNTLVSHSINPNFIGRVSDLIFQNNGTAPGQSDINSATQIDQVDFELQSSGNQSSILINTSQTSGITFNWPSIVTGDFYTFQCTTMTGTLTLNFNNDSGGSYYFTPTPCAALVVDWAAMNGCTFYFNASFNAASVDNFFNSADISGALNNCTVTMTGATASPVTSTGAISDLETNYNCTITTN